GDVSPTRFHNSVHNAPAGYWAIALSNRAPSTSLCANDASFGAGLLEAIAYIATENEPSLLVAYDLPHPEPLKPLWPIDDPFASAFVLVRDERGDRLASIEVTLESGDGCEPASTWPPMLPVSLAANPAALCLPLVALLARDDVRSAYVRY